MSWVSVTRPRGLTFSMPSKAMFDLQLCLLSSMGQTHSVALIWTRFFLKGTYLDLTAYIYAYIA